MHIKKDDIVVVISGRDAGDEPKQGKVLSVDPENGKVIVEGVSMAKRHKKPRKQGQPGGIIKMETPIYASKVMRVCPKCKKPTRHAVKVDLTQRTTKSGKPKAISIRVCKKCGAEI